MLQTLENAINYILSEDTSDVNIGGDIVLKIVERSTGEKSYKMLTYKDGYIAWGMDDIVEVFKNFPVISMKKTKGLRSSSMEPIDIWHIDVLDVRKSTMVEN